MQRTDPIDDLQDASPDGRPAAAHALAHLAESGLLSPPAIGPLIAALDDESLATRRFATAALGRLGRLGPSAKRTVWAALSHRALSDSDGQVRKLASEALAGLQEPAAAEPADPVSALREELCEVPEEEAIDRLVLRGRRLEGAPLRRSSWAVVARALTDLRAGDHLLRILASASTRDHALRALRIARAARANLAAEGRGGAHGGPGAARKEQAIRRIDHNHEDDDYYDDEYPYSYDPDSLEGASRDKLPGVLPVNAVQAAADDYTDRALTLQ